MKHYISALFVFVLFLTSCQAMQPTPTPTQAPVPTSTFMPLPPSTNTPEPTLTPEPTFTPEPSPTTIVLPNMFHQTFSNVTIVYRDGFEYVIGGLAPQGWETDERNAIWVTTENQLKAQPADTGYDWSGTVFYFSKEIIVPNSGVYFTFKYIGLLQIFTLGFDAVTKKGERIKGNDFYSVAMQMDDNFPSAHIIQGTFLGTGYFKGNLRLQEDTWYDIALGFDDKENYIIKIWNPDYPEKQLTYVRNWKDFPTNYHFISWLGAKRSLLIDDFTVFKFDSITLK